MNTSVIAGRSDIRGWLLLCQSRSAALSLFLSVLFFAALCLARPAQAYDITDDRGVVISLPEPPRRIVSLLPSLTETVCELGACGRLVGVDRYSNWPAGVRKLPQVGGGLDPNIEAIVALKPDVVLVATSSRASDRLRALGLKVIALEPKTGPDVRRVIEKLGEVLQISGAARVARAIDEGVAAAARTVPESARGLRVYFEASPGPHGAGPESFIGEMLTALGLRNILAPQLGPFPKLNPEYVLRADPDLIMAGQRSLQELGQRPGWRNLRAVKEGRVCIFDAAEVDALVRPGPRMAEAARLMARCVSEKGVAAGAPR